MTKETQLLVNRVSYSLLGWLQIPEFPVFSEQSGVSWFGFLLSFLIEIRLPRVLGFNGVLSALGLRQRTNLWRATTIRVAEALTLCLEADPRQRPIQAERWEGNKRCWQKLKEDPERFARRKEAMAIQTQRRERNKRYWQKLKEDPQRFARRKEAMARNRELARLRKTNR